MSAMTMNKLKGNMCRWPIGDPKDDDFHFCGSPSELDRSYCEEHTEMAHAQTRGHVNNRTKKKD